MMRTADDARMLRSVNPATLGIIADTDIMSDEEIDQIIRSAHRRFTAWRSVPVEERAARLDALAASLRRYAETAADIISIEMGKPVTQARAEIEKCAVACVYYAREAPSMLASEGIPFDGAHARIVHEPLGVLLAIMPWNLPYWQSIRALVPAIVAGNTVVIKPAPEVTLSAESLQRIIQDAGLGDGIVSTLRANVEQTGRCIEHRLVAGVTFTGSTGAGRAVAARAGQALKKTVLELGGSDAVLVCSDADVAMAARIAAASRLVNNGQSCIAAKRCIVMRSVLEEFEQALSLEMQGAVMGDPRDPATTLGPMARADLVATLHAQVTHSVRMGARVVLDGGPTGTGCFFAPMIIGDVTRGMPLYDEETFGPVMSIIAAETDEEMVRLANDTPYGLGATVVSTDPARASRIASAVEAGMVFINDMVRSDARLPFGGVKHSGWGRELGPHGILEFVNVKTVVGA